MQPRRPDERTAHQRATTLVARRDDALERAMQQLIELNGSTRRDIAEVWWEEVHRGTRRAG